MSQPWMGQVDRYCRQYLQLEPQLDFPDATFLRLPEVQETIFTRLFADGAVRYGPPLRYQVKTLKNLVSQIEASIDNWDEHEVSENIMTALSLLLATPLPSEVTSVQRKCYVTYHLSRLPSALPSTGPDVDCPYITLLENRSLISAGGTTGLRTWEAALHLGQYLCQNPSVIRSKHILELGAGTGYLSLLCARYLSAAHVIASDGSNDVINNLPENFFLNDLQESNQIAPMDVKWGHALLGTEEEAWNGGRPVDVVLGADVTYDQSVIPALVATLLDLIAMHPRVEIFISATQRNEETFRAFLETCRQNHLAVDDLEFDIPSRADQQGPFYSDQVAIRICRVSKCKD